MKFEYDGCVLYHYTKKTKVSDKTCTVIGPVKLHVNETTDTITFTDELGKSHVYCAKHGGYDSIEAAAADLKAKQAACIASSGETDMTDQEKEIVGIIQVIDPDNPKETLNLFLFRNPDCVTTDFEGTNVVNLKDYEMANIAGAVIPQNLAELTTEGCVTICIAAASTIILEDVLAEGVADGTLLPDGTAPTGFILGSITKFGINQIGKDSAGVAKKDGVQVVYYDGDEAINASSTYCPKVHPVLVDDDCDKFLAGSDLTKGIENPSATETAIVRVCGTFIPLDADDTDAAVQ